MRIIIVSLFLMTFALCKEVKAQPQKNNVNTNVNPINVDVNEGSRGVSRSTSYRSDGNRDRKSNPRDRAHVALKKRREDDEFEKEYQEYLRFVNDHNKRVGNKFELPVLTKEQYITNYIFRPGTLPATELYSIITNNTVSSLISNNPDLNLSELYRLADKKYNLKKPETKPSPKAIAPKANYRYSFSGSDCNVFAKTNNNSPIHLDSVSTVSVSIYEAKAPVRRLGYSSPVGFTGNIRTVAGSIICVLRDNHPLSELMGYPNKHKKHRDDKDEVFNSSNFNSGALFPFDLMLMYKNEVGDALGFSIYNVEIISEGIVTSTNDMITEVVLQFQATHIDQIEKKS